MTAATWTIRCSTRTRSRRGRFTRIGWSRTTTEPASRGTRKCMRHRRATAYSPNTTRSGSALAEGANALRGRQFLDAFLHALQFVLQVLLVGSQHLGAFLLAQVPAAGAASISTVVIHGVISQDEVSHVPVRCRCSW